jgi:transposase-like protein
MTHFGGSWQKKGHGSQYERKKEAALSALLTQRSIEDAARVIGVGFSTLRRWMRIPEFEAAYREARRDAMWQSIARLQQNSGAAATTILKIMVDPDAPPSCRLRAAERVFEYALRGMEIEDLQARVSALERGAHPGPVHELGGFNDAESDFETDKAA